MSSLANTRYGVDSRTLQDPTGGVVTDHRCGVLLAISQTAQGCDSSVGDQGARAGSSLVAIFLSPQGGSGQHAD